jgi:hypothetical protein
MNKNDGGTRVGANITTIDNTDVLECFIKVTATDVKWYYRKNSGSFTLGDTQTTRIPTTASNYITAAASNLGTATDMKMVLKTMAFER